MKETKFKQTLVQTKDERRKTKEGTRHCERSEAIQGGFKMTEVGMIPCDWEVKTLEEVCQNQGIVRGPFGGALKKEMFVSSGYKVYEQKNAIYKSVDLGQYFVDASKYREMARFSIKPGDFIVSCSGTIGKIFKIPKKAPEGIINQALLKLSADEGKISSDYFITYFECDHFQSAIIDDTQGGAMKNLVGMDKFRKSLFILPPTIKEQQRIANALSDVDTLIANLEKLIAKKKNIKQGAMQQLLTGKKRLPGFAPDEKTGSRPTDERRKACHSERSAKREVEESSGYKMTELGLIPSDWEFVPVSELAKDMADGPFGSNLKKEHYTSDPQTRIIQLSNIGENGWEDENTKYTTFEHAKTIARCIVPKEESILVAKMMPAGRAIICPKKEKQYVLGSDVIRITANEKLNSKYFVYASKSDAYLKQISDNTQGSTRQRTSISKLRKILILLPSIAEQTAIANVLSDMDAEISALETKLAKYRTLKTGMMQQLLTGKTRLLQKGDKCV